MTAYVQTPAGQLVEGPEADLDAYIAANPGAKPVTPEQATEIARVNAVRESQSGAIPAAVQVVESGIVTMPVVAIVPLTPGVKTGVATV